MSDLTTFARHCRVQAVSARVMPTGERALWRQLADEVDAYLVADPDVVAAPDVETGPGLFDEELA